MGWFPAAAGITFIPEIFPYLSISANISSFFFLPPSSEGEKPT
jgi:hypothetical protein